MIAPTFVIVKNADSTHEFEATTQGVTAAAAAFTVEGQTVQVTLGDGISVPAPGTLRVTVPASIGRNLPDGVGEYDVITGTSTDGRSLVARGRVIVKSGHATL
jgi:hypothetical protein